MKILFSAFVGLCLSVIAFSATAGDHGDVADAIKAQEAHWAASLLRGDLDAVDALMHPNFRLVRAYSDGPAISKADYLGMEGMSANAADVTSVAIVEKAGPIVVARVTWTMDWSQEGYGKLPPHFDMIDTWVKGDDGAYRILSRVSQLADGPPEAD